PGAGGRGLPGGPVLRPGTVEPRCRPADPRPRALLVSLPPLFRALLGAGDPAAGPGAAPQGSGPDPGGRPGHPRGEAPERRRLRGPPATGARVGPGVVDWDRSSP